MIRLERDQFAATFDALDSGVVVLDSDQRVVCWNYWFAAASHISSERAVGKTISELFPGRSLVRLTTSITEALDLGSSALLTHSLNPNMYPGPFAFLQFHGLRQSLRRRGRAHGVPASSRATEKTIEPTTVQRGAASCDQTAVIMGYRAGRLSGWAIPARMGRME